MKDENSSMEITIVQHYDLLVDEEIDPVHDGEALRVYMSRWDGAPFFKALGPLKGKKVLEVGIGTGRIAKQVLGRGCKLLVGVDFSPKTIERARENLSNFENLELLQIDVETAPFAREGFFDCAYSVLSFMHFRNKQAVLAAMVDSLTLGGRLVLSVSHEKSEWLDYGPRKIRLFLSPAQDYVRWLADLRCKVENPIELVDRIILPNGKKSAQFGEVAATLITAVKE